MKMFCVVHIKTNWILKYGFQEQKMFNMQLKRLNIIFLKMTRTTTIGFEKVLQMQMFYAVCIRTNWILNSEQNCLNTQITIFMSYFQGRIWYKTQDSRSGRFYIFVEDVVCSLSKDKLDKGVRIREVEDVSFVDEVVCFCLPTTKQFSKN